ncbi:MAG: hypothetical protein AAGH64_03110 [Planctomycetota bacterium]
MTPARIASALAVFTVLGIALVVAQPSLTPPAGPVIESGRFGTLIEINNETAPPDGLHRHVITRPGSYILTGDVEARDMNGILVDADNVTIDLNGFTVDGRGPAGVTVPDPSVDPGREIRGLTVRNGRIVGFETGVRGRRSTSGGTPTEFRGVDLEDLEIRSALIGIGVREAQIRGCTVYAESIGIDASESLVESCLVFIEDREPGGAGGLPRVGVRVQRSTVEGTRVRIPSELVASTGYLSSGGNIFRGCAVVTGGRGFNIGGSIADGCLSQAGDGNTVPLGALTFDSNF